MIQASSIIGCSKATVMQKFPHHRINFIPDPSNLDKELMEIWLENVGITYIINKQDICIAGYLFLDDATKLEKYLNICNRCFKIVAKNSWRYKNCRIELKKEGADFYFEFTPN